MSQNTPARITVVDYGMGNLRSVQKIVSRIGAEVRISSTEDDLEWGDRLILPGVGAFADAMKRLRELNLVDILNDQVIARKKPILGICLGMELMARSSTELGHTVGLGWFEADVIGFDRAKGIRVPHVGWNHTEIKKERPLFAGLSGQPTCYYVHSFHMVCEDPKDVLACSEYGGTFTAAIGKGNILGTQFHPEKSQANGFQILVNYVTGDLQ